MIREDLAIASVDDPIVETSTTFDQHALERGAADDTAEVRKAQGAATVLKKVGPYEGLYPPVHILPRLEAARA